MIPTIVESTPLSPQLKMSQKGAVENDKEDSKIPKSLFSKESASCKKSAESDQRNTQKPARKVSFQCPDSAEEGKSSSSPQQEEDAVDKCDMVVSFNKRVRIRKIRQLEDMPAEQIKATYFSEQELMEIRYGLRTKIRSLVEQNFQEELHEDDIDDEKETTFCIRGLEHEFPRGKYRRKQLKMMSRGAVFEEQRLQREFFVHNERSESTHDTASTLSTVGCWSLAHEEPELAIADVYRIESKAAVQLALEYARRDMYVADQIYFSHQAI